MKMKKYLILCCIFLCGLLFQQAPKALAQTTEEVTLYDMGSAYNEKITQPASLPRSYQIPQAGNGISYKITSGENCVTVSDNGMVTVKRKYFKKADGYFYSVSEGEAYDYYTMEAGDAEISVISAAWTTTLTVHVKSYAEVYANEVMDAYIAENFTDGMSSDEIAEAIAKFPAQYDYDTGYQSAVSMVVFGKGDCWASTNTIIYLAKKLGYDAWSRNGNRDGGAGGGHINAMVEIHGTYYELEAGYAMDKGEDGYRPYDARRRNSLFSYHMVDTQTAAISQYDGKSWEGEIEIPKEIDGHPIVKIEKSAFAGTNFTKIVIPEGVKSISAYAFSGCRQLNQVVLNDGLESIGAYCFKDDPDLSVIRITSTVTSIGAGAFYGDKLLRKIYFYGDAPAFGGTVSGVYYDKVFAECANGLEAYYPTGNTTWDDAACSAHDGENVTWKSWSAGTLTTMEEAEVILEPDTYEYTGSRIEPQKITVRMGESQLTEGEDYLVTYPVNETGNVGTAAVEIVGVGRYTDVKNVYYTIGKAELRDKPSILNTTIEVGDTAECVYSSSDQASFGSKNSAVVTINQEGNITGISVGTAVITITIPESENYKAWYQEVAVTVVDPNEDPENSKTSRDGSKNNTNSDGKSTTSAGNDPSDPDRKNDGNKSNVGQIFTYQNARYRITANGKAAFTGLAKSQKKVKIPSSVSYDGRSYQVTAVAAKACAGNKKLTKLIIGENVTKIGKRAFWKCKKLKKVVYQGAKLSKRSIGKQAFAGTSLK